MATRTFKFSGTAHWVVQQAENTIQGGTNVTVEVNRTRPTSGTFKITAPTQKEIDKASQVLNNHAIFKLHFTQI